MTIYDILKNSNSRISSGRTCLVFNGTGFSIMISDQVGIDEIDRFLAEKINE